MTTATTIVSTVCLLVAAVLVWRYRSVSFATADTLRGLATRRYKTVVIDGIKFRIHSLTEHEKSLFETSILSTAGDVDGSKLITARRRLVAMCLVDESGRQLFTELDNDELGQVDGRVMDRLHSSIIAHCGFSTQDVKEVTEAAELLKVLAEFQQVAPKETNGKKHPNRREAERVGKMFRQLGMN